MSGVQRRFLLDQGFPKPTLDIEALDARVTFTHLGDWAPHLAEVSTPDWLVVLEAGASNLFDGMVTRDHASLADAKGLVSLMHTELALITWKRPIEDPVTEWGQLVAFLSEIIKVLDDRRDVVIFLPKPRLQRGEKQVKLPRALLGERASRGGVSFSELRDGARSDINDELNARGREELLLAR